MPSQREFRQRLESEILILDGAMGTMLQSLTKKIACIDEANLLHPELIRNVHCSYAEAGADIISTNTFGANRIKLDSYGLADVVIRLNSEAARLAKLAVSSLSVNSRSNLFTNVFKNRSLLCWRVEWICF